MEENIIYLIGEITKLTMKLNNKCEDDFFVRYSGHTNGFELFYVEDGYRENENVEQKNLLFLFIKNTEEDVRKLEGAKKLLLNKLENKNEPLKKVQNQKNKNRYGLPSVSPL